MVLEKTQLQAQFLKFVRVMILNTNELFPAT